MENVRISESRKFELSGSQNIIQFESIHTLHVDDLLEIKCTRLWVKSKWKMSGSQRVENLSCPVLRI